MQKLLFIVKCRACWKVQIDASRPSHFFKFKPPHHRLKAPQETWAGDGPVPGAATLGCINSKEVSHFCNIRSGWKP